MVKPRMRMVRMLSMVILMALPFGLGGCFETNTPPPTGSSPLPSINPGATPTDTPPSPSDTPSSPVSSSPVPQPGTMQGKAEVYWLRTSGNKLALAPANVTLEPSTGTADAKLKAAIERLIKGPANADVTSSIPPETKLKSLTVKPDGIHVDLSQAFTTGGGSTSMQGRLGQVIYTASSLKPADPVWISVEGEPLQVLGGEGVEVSQPMTRDEFVKNFSL